MSTMKTAISITPSLLRAVDAAAHEMDIPRSRFFAVAAEEFLDQRHNRQLLDIINRTYDDDLDPAERAWTDSMRARHRQVVEGEW